MHDNSLVHDIESHTLHSSTQRLRDAMSSDQMLALPQNLASRDKPAQVHRQLASW